MNPMTHQADKQTVATANPVHAENLPVTVAAVQTAVPQQTLVPQSAAADKVFVAPKPVAAGKAPAPNAAAAIQMEQEAAAGQARQSADKLLRKKRPGESAGDQNAESSADASYDVAAAAASEEPATPTEATTSAPSAGGAAGSASSGTAWIPIAGGGLGLAAIGGGGTAAAAAATTSTAAAATTTASTFAVSIAAVAGPVTAALNYRIYDAQGKVIASGVTDANGKVTADIDSAYAGQPLLIKLFDANGAAPDFRDETTNGAGAGKDLGSTALRAAFVATGGSQSVTVSPITEVAVQKMGITTDAATAPAATVTATNTSVGNALGVSDILGAVTTVLSADYNEANGLSAAEAYGQALAKLSGLDQANGSMSATFTALLNALNIPDATVRAATLATLLNEGAVRFEAGTNGNLATLPVLPTLAITDDVATGPTNAPVTYTFTFSEAVTGFDASGVTVTNGTKGAFTPVTASIYTLVVTPTANAQGADIGVSVNAGIVYQGTSATTIAKTAAAQAYDTIAPAAPGAPDMTAATDSGASSTDNLTKNTAPTFTGTAEANATVTLYEGTTVRGTGTANAAGSYAITSSTLTEGAHTLTVKATDAAGNVSAASSGLNLTIDTIAPAAATIDMVATDDAINAGEQTVAITGTAEANASVALTLGANVRTVTADGSGNWTYTLVAADIIAIGQGTGKTLSVTQTDVAGNVGTAGTRTIAVDTVAATVSSVALTGATNAQNSTLNAGDIVTATVTFSEAVTVNTGTGTPQLALNIGGTTVQADYAGGTGTATLTFSYTIPAGQTDTNGIAVALNGLALNNGTIKDAAGNNATLTHAAVADNASYLVDTTAPAIGTISFNAAENGTAAASLTATDTGAVTWGNLTGDDAGLFSLGSGGVLTFQAAKNYEAPDDTGANRIYELSVQATDAAGNTTTQAITVNLTDVNEAPTVANAIPDQTFVVGGAVDSFTFAANAFTDPDTTAPNNTLTYTATLSDGSALPAWLSFDAGTRTFSGNPPANGTTTVRVTATDGGTGNLHTFDDFVITAVTAPTITSTIDNVTNLDVTSNIVLTASENVTAVGGRFIHVVNDGGAGYQGEATTHSFDIDVSDTSKVTISGNKITVNPDLLFDLDLANDYHITIDAGAFLGVVSGQASVAVSDVMAMNFSTVTPGTGGLANAATSVTMANGVDAVSTGSKWLDVVGVGDPTGSATTAGATYDLSTGSFVIVGGKDNDNAGGDGSAYDGITVLNTYWVALLGFSANDTIYIDDQFNNAAKVNDFSVSSYIAATNPPTSIQFSSTVGQAYVDVTVPGLNPTFSSLAEFQAATSNHAVISG